MLESHDSRNRDLNSSENIGNMSYSLYDIGYIWYEYATAINPYWQILENSSRNFSEICIFWVVTQAVLLENSSNFFSEISILGRHTGRFIGKLIH